MKIEDTELLKKITGNEKIPISNGSGTPATITVNLILENVPEPKLIKERISDLENRVSELESKLDHYLRIVEER